jgi:hypothetical protein
MGISKEMEGMIIEFRVRDERTNMAFTVRWPAGSLVAQIMDFSHAEVRFMEEPTLEEVKEAATARVNGL